MSGKFIDPIILDPSSIRKYVVELPRIKKLIPDSTEMIYDERDRKCRELAEYTIKMREIMHKFHPEIPETTIWSYNDSIFLIDTERFNSTKVKWIDCLPTTHLLEAYIDRTLHGAGPDQPSVRNVTHRHGGEQAPTSDGDPIDWITPGQCKIDEYPNSEQPTMLWYHDHAVGITRLNAYAGLAGSLHIIRDETLEESLNLPRGRFEIPLVISDKTFSIDGQLVFATEAANPKVHPKWDSHFLGNMITVNNAVWPFLKVNRNKYRFRILNASDTRTYSMKLVKVGGLLEPGPAFFQIGSDGGYLPHPVILNNPFEMNSPELRLAIAERADIIIDFSKCQPGEEYILVNTANAPYPNGPVPDGNTVGQIMKFIIKETKGKRRFNIAVGNNFRRINPSNVSVNRQLILGVNQAGDQGPWALYLNNDSFMRPVTERPIVGSTEIWELINLTGGMHPIHLHLIDFQLFNRQQFRRAAYQDELISKNPNLAIRELGGTGIRNLVDVTPFLEGNPVEPENGEIGWKDTIQSPPGMVTRIIVRWSPQTIGIDYPFDPTRGPYVWHCHILSHEDNDMMRPFRLYFNCEKEC